MPQYLSPGVYVEEVAGTPPIVGVGTSTVGIIGAVNTGGGFTMPAMPDGSGNYTIAPVDEPRLVTDWTQFKNQFGDFQAGNLNLAHAVYGFFNNGGTRCWVARTADLTNAGNVGTTLAKLEPIDEIAIVTAPGARRRGPDGHYHPLLRPKKSLLHPGWAGYHYHHPSRHSEHGRQQRLRRPVFPTDPGLRPGQQWQHLYSSQRPYCRHLCPRGCYPWGA